MGKQYGISTGFGIVFAHDLPPMRLRKDKRRLDMRCKVNKEIKSYEAALHTKAYEMYMAGHNMDGAKIMSFTEWKTAASG